MLVAFQSSCYGLVERGRQVQSSCWRVLLPLLMLPAVAEGEVDSNRHELLQSRFQQVVSAAGRETEVSPMQPVSIALVYPSADISDFWIRNYRAMTARLTELGIPFVSHEFASTQLQHSLQERHVDDVLANSDDYDFVIIGPTELEVQAGNIQRLAASDEFSTFVWAFHTPDPSWQHSPAAWFDFSSSMGARSLCDYLVDSLGEGVYFAMNRGIPGVTDQQRSGEFKQCVEQSGNWINRYEHFGQYQKAGGADGAALVLKHFPEVTVLHNANTAMTMGAIDATSRVDAHDRLFITGWGGTRKEISKIREGVLDATPMRMSDDLGVATAEAIRYNLEGRQNEVPEIYLGRITVVSSDMTAARIDQLMEDAFRYSGLDDIEPQ